MGWVSASLMWTWISAAPASRHSLAVVTSSSSVTGSAGTAAFAVSAPVGATVIIVAAAGVGWCSVRSSAENAFSCEL